MPVDIKKFTDHLYVAALKNKRFGNGQCGLFVRVALEAGGANFHGANPPTGKQFGRALEKLGFHEITVKDPAHFNFMVGDVMVMEPHKGSTAGHVAGYNGKYWISDFIQTDFWAGPDYRREKPHYAVYRY